MGTLRVLLALSVLAGHASSILGSTFTNNGGDAVRITYNNGGGLPAFSGNTFTSNTGYYGGAVYIDPTDRNAGGFFTVPKVVE